MKIAVKVKTNSKNPKVEKLGELNYEIKVKARPIEGEANREVIRMLAEYMKIPLSRMRIVKGRRSKNKLVEIL